MGGDKTEACQTTFTQAHMFTSHTDTYMCAHHRIIYMFTSHTDTHICAHIQVRVSEAGSGILEQEEY